MVTPISFEILNVKATLAYVGPGAGIAALGTLIAVVVAIIAAIFGFAWYPLKRLLRKRKRIESNTNQIEEGEGQ